MSLTGYGRLPLPLVAKRMTNYHANLEVYSTIAVQFLNVIVDKQGGTEAEDAGDNRLEAEPEADLQGR